MKVLAVFTSKGGSGKSTVAIHLAVLASQQKRQNKVLVLDYDVQSSSRSWTQIREAETPAVLPATAGDLSGILAQARKEDFDLVIVDMPPHSAANADVVMRESDLVVIPVRPSALDLWALETTVDAVRSNGARGVFVLNQVPPTGSEGDEAEKALRDLAPRVPVAKSRLVMRKAFSTALNGGMAITEFAPPSDKASKEAVSLFKEIKGML